MAIESSNQRTRQDHHEDPDRPGWCAACGRVYPCPATLTRAQARAIAVKFGGKAL